MASLPNVIQQLDWDCIAPQLDAEGYAIVPGLFAPEMAGDLARQCLAATAHRPQSLESNDLGHGELSYIDDHPSALWASLRTTFYRHLAPIANRWNETLDVKYRYPAQLSEFVERNRQAGQVQAQSHVIRLGTQDYLSLHQRNDGAHVFPMQVAVLLSEPGVDFEGGEFVLTEQRPRMQSRPMVLPLGVGDAAIFSTAERPFKGAKGHYRVNIRHAISRVRTGERIGVELSFHDA